MPIEGITQPSIICINPSLRLRAYDGNYALAYDWYQDENMLRLVDGVDYEVYTMKTLKEMYDFFNEEGEQYWIEYGEEGKHFFPIGDVVFSQTDSPIVIGLPTYRGRGIGKDVISALIQRARSLGYTFMEIEEVYYYNLASQKLFESLGFSVSKKTKNGYAYRKDLTPFAW